MHRNLAQHPPPRHGVAPVLRKRDKEPGGRLFGAPTVPVGRAHYSSVVQEGPCPLTERRWVARGPGRPTGALSWADVTISQDRLTRHNRTRPEAVRPGGGSVTDDDGRTVRSGEPGLPAAGHTGTTGRQVAAVFPGEIAGRRPKSVADPTTPSSGVCASSVRTAWHVDNCSQGRLCPESSTTSGTL